MSCDPRGMQSKSDDQVGGPSAINVGRNKSKGGLVAGGRDLEKSMLEGIMLEIFKSPSKRGDSRTRTDDAVAVKSADLSCQALAMFSRHRPDQLGPARCASF